MTEAAAEGWKHPRPVHALLRFRLPNASSQFEIIGPSHAARTLPGWLSGSAWMRCRGACKSIEARLSYLQAGSYPVHIRETLSDSSFRPVRG